nr:MAG TPA: hypothetical protein [Caudoviricetes sp.]
MKLVDYEIQNNFFSKEKLFLYIRKHFDFEKFISKEILLSL